MNLSESIEKNAALRGELSVLESAEATGAMA